MYVRIRTVMLVFLAITLAALSDCEALGSVRGGDTDNGAHGRVKMGFHFDAR